MNRTVIGLGGVAGAGKDLFFSLLSKKLPVRRFALADELKRETTRLCMEAYGVDPTNCTREDKEKIRPFLVDYGTQKRNNSNGRHWVDKLSSQIKGFLLNAVTEDIPVVTDIRYQEYDNDEVYWVKEEMGGVLVHISQFEIHRATGEKNFLQPANSEEERMDPIVKSLADYEVTWPRVKEDIGRSAVLNQHVNDFVEWYKNEH